MHHQKKKKLKKSKKRNQQTSIEYSSYQPNNPLTIYYLKYIEKKPN
jgi:hypothetical protein